MMELERRGLTNVGLGARIRVLTADCNPVDLLNLGYLVAGAILLVLAPHPPAKQLPLLLTHVGLCAAIIALVTLRQRGGLLQFLSYWYPLALSAFFFEEINSLVHLFQPGWYDRFFIHLDYLTFGAHPTVWFERHISSELTEVMNFFYFSYWPLIPVAAGLVWWKRRERFVHFVFALGLSYVICYLIFIFLPVEGPYHTLRSLQTVGAMPGGVFTWLVGFVEKHGRIHGGAFPSAHIAGSVIALMAIYRISRRLGLATLVIVVGICISTVYGRYHYAADIWGGVLVAIIGDLITGRILCRTASVEPGHFGNTR